MNEILANQWIFLMVGGIFILILVPVLFVWSYRRRRRKLLENGRPALAKILKTWDTGVTIGTSSSANNGGNMHGVGLLLEVYPEGGQPYQTKSREQLHIFDVSRIGPGMMVEVRVDPNNPQRVAVANWNVAAAPAG